jgi:hypothetical protein
MTSVLQFREPARPAQAGAAGWELHRGGHLRRTARSANTSTPIRHEGLRRVDLLARLGAPRVPVVGSV